jgi:DNA polymerase elongation subunit (family B)
MAFDLVSLYNRIIQTYNISPETWNPETNIFDLRGDELGIVPEICMELEQERNRYKKLRKQSTDPKLIKRYDLRQASFKTMILTYYGELGRNGSRYFNRAIAEFITYSGRNMINGSDLYNDPLCPLRKDLIMENAPKQIVEDLGFEVLYGDTDSVYIKIGILSLSNDSIIKIAKDIQKRFEDSYEKYFERIGVPMDRRRIEMELQGYYGFMCLTSAKKRYVNLTLYDGDKGEWISPKLYYKGHELVKSSSCKFTKHSQRGLFGLMKNMFLKDDFSEEKMISYLKTQRKILLSGRINKDLVLRKSTKSNLNDYKTTSPHIRAAKKLESRGKFIAGQKIEFVVAEDSKRGIVAEPIEDGNIPEITASGLRYYWDRHFWNFSEETIGTMFDIGTVRNAVVGQSMLNKWI